METLPKFAKERVRLLLEVLPGGRDLYLAMAKNRLGITYRGKFESYTSARAAASNSRSNEYDVVNATKAKNREREKLTLDTWFETEDYAPLFWLSKILDEKSAVLELGGSIGHFFYTIQQYHPCPSNVSWTIAELPEAVKLGREVAEERGERRLSFLDSTMIGTAKQADVFLSAGTLQYMEDPVWGILKSLVETPKHVILHNLPVHKTSSLWTLQRLALCELPYRIYSRAELIDQMTSLGYNTVAEWGKPRTIEIPFHRNVSIEGYLGFYFKR